MASSYPYVLCIANDDLISAKISYFSRYKFDLTLLTDSSIDLWATWRAVCCVTRHFSFRPEIPRTSFSRREIRWIFFDLPGTRRSASCPRGIRKIGADVRLGTPKIACQQAVSHQRPCLLHTTAQGNLPEITEFTAKVTMRSEKLHIVNLYQLILSDMRSVIL